MLSIKINNETTISMRHINSLDTLFYYSSRLVVSNIETLLSSWRLMDGMVSLGFLKSWEEETFCNQDMEGLNKGKTIWWLTMQWSRSRLCPPTPVTPPEKLHERSFGNLLHLEYKNNKVPGPHPHRSTRLESQLAYGWHWNDDGRLKKVFLSFLLTC